MLWKASRMDTGWERAASQTQKAAVLIPGPQPPLREEKLKVQLGVSGQCLHPYCLSNDRTSTGLPPNDQVGELWTPE